MTAADLGRWIKVLLHFKPDSGAGDGVFELAIDGKPVVSTKSFAQGGAPCSPGYFKQGYLLGWANSGFAKDTNVYIDDVTFSANPI